MAGKKAQIKKAVIFIVEGNSDKQALERIFQKIYKTKNIVCKFTNGDITSDENMNESKVVGAIYNKVDEYMKDKKLLPKHIWQIVHIFDTDGAYVPDTAIMKGGTKEFMYSPTCISCKNVQSVLDRNKRKSNLMNYLLGIQDIKGIPYICYFVSSNLDHALYNIQNLNKELKGDYADAFYSEFEGKEEMFIDFLKEEVANGVPTAFLASWRYIKEDVHSLERHTNLHIYFEMNPYL